MFGLIVLVLAGFYVAVGLLAYRAYVDVCLKSQVKRADMKLFLLAMVMSILVICVGGLFYSISRNDPYYGYFYLFLATIGLHTVALLLAKNVWSNRVLVWSISVGALFTPFHLIYSIPTVSKFLRIVERMVA